MIDRYTKFILTVIATALSAIAVGQFTPAARAQGAACGSISNPCHALVSNRYLYPLQVHLVD